MSKNNIAANQGSVQETLYGGKLDYAGSLKGMSRGNLDKRGSSKIIVTNSKDEVILKNVTQDGGVGRESYQLTVEGDLVICEGRGTLLIKANGKDFSKKPSTEQIINSP